MSDHQPIQPEYQAKMRALAETLDDFLNGEDRPKKTGFVVLMFPFGEGNPNRKRINYISNAERTDMIVALKEIVARFEGRLIEPTSRQ